MFMTRNQKGVSIVAAVFIITILAFMGVMLVTLVSTSSLTSVNDVQAAQALAVADGGLEYILENRLFPNYSMGGATPALGSGTFTVATPTYLTADPGAAGATINVQSTANFPNAGRITIDSELISYTGTTAISFTGAARGVGGTTATAHPVGNAVYPSTTVTVDPGAAGTTITVASTGGFLTPGVIKIDTEYIYCAGATGNSFTGCIRAYKGSTAAVHPVGSAVFQYILTSTGAVGNARRVVKQGVWSASPATVIAFDAASSTTANAGSVTWSHTVAGANRVLLVGVSIRNNAGQTVSGVTYAGQPLTPVVSLSNGTSVRAELWQRVGPATGANNVVVTLSASARFVAGAVSFTGVDQTNPIDAFNSNSGSSNAPAVNVATVTDYAWVVDTLANRVNATAAAGAGQTQRWNNATGGGTNNVRGAGSTEGPKFPPGAVTMSWTLSSSQDWALTAAALKPVPGTAALIDWREVVP
jgi:hypothetical protein